MRGHPIGFALTDTYAGPLRGNELVMTIVGTALNLDAGAREPFLRSVCGSDEKLYKEAKETLELEAKMVVFSGNP